MAVWSDVGVLGGEFVTMVGDSSGTVQFRRWNGGQQQLISQVSFGRTAAQYRMCVAGGRCYAVAQVGARIDECMVIRDDGKKWNSGMSAVGTNCVGLRDAGGKLEAAWVRTGVDKLCRVFLSYDLEPLEDTIRQVPISIGPTTEGFLLFNNAGEPEWTKTNVPRRFNEATGYLWHESELMDWEAFQENGYPERVSVRWFDGGALYLVAEAHTEAPPRISVLSSDDVDGDDVLVAIGGHDWFVPRSQFRPWTPPNPAPVPTPVPVPTPEPQPMPDFQIPRSPVSDAEIAAVVAECKAEVEAAGIVYWTDAQVAQFYAENGKDATFPKAQQEKALMATSRAAVRLAQRYPSAQIGLERYSGPSSVAGVSYDIILLGRSGPSSDVMAGGVRPVSQIPPDHEVTPEMVAAWRSDWVAPFIYRPDLTPVQEPVPTPTPLPAPAPLPTPGNTDAVLAFLRDLDAKVDALAAVVGATADAVTAVRDGLNVMDLNVETLLMDVDQIRNQEYETRIFGSSVTLRPKR